MKLKGIWDADTTYDVGDVVMFEEDGNVYHLQSPCKSGITPMDTLYWSRTSQTIQDIVNLVLDGIGLLKVPTNIDDEGIVLKTEDAEYYVYVDDSGNTPELAVEAVDNTPDNGLEVV